MCFELLAKLVQKVAAFNLTMPTGCSLALPRLTAFVEQAIVRMAHPRSDRPCRAVSRNVVPPLRSHPASGALPPRISYLGLFSLDELRRRHGNQRLHEAASTGARKDSRCRLVWILFFSAGCAAGTTTAFSLPRRPS